MSRKCSETDRKNVGSSRLKGQRAGKSGSREGGEGGGQSLKKQPRWRKGEWPSLWQLLAAFASVGKKDDNMLLMDLTCKLSSSTASQTSRGSRTNNPQRPMDSGGWQAGRGKVAAGRRIRKVAEVLIRNSTIDSDGRYAGCGSVTLALDIGDDCFDFDC